MIQNPVINNSELVKSVNGINPDSSGNVTLPNFGSTDQWICRYNEVSVNENTAPAIVQIPQEAGYTCVAAFSPCTNGWVGGPYITTTVNQYQQFGSVSIYYVQPPIGIQNPTVGCNFLYFKNS